jgi:hypothetical protein
LRSLGIPSDGSSPPTQVLDEASRPWGRRQHLKFESEPGVEVEGTLYIPDSAGRKPAVLAVADKSPHYSAPTIDSLAERMAIAGRIVLALEPRASLPEDADRPFLGDWLANARANQIGRNLPAMRAHDILRGVDLLSSRSDVDPDSIRALARGVKGVWLLLAAAADARIGKIWLDRTPYSLRVALETTMNNDLFDAVIPGFALHWDLEDLTRAMGNRPVMLTDPTTWMQRVIPLPPPFRYRYVLGDTTDLSDEQNDAYLAELMK